VLKSNNDVNTARLWQSACLSLSIVIGVCWPQTVQSSDTFSGFEVPRFVALKSSLVNARRGPSKDQPIEWQYKLRGLPVEVIAETEEWRQIRDWEGQEAWIHQNLLAGNRNLFVVGDGTGRDSALREDPEGDAPIVAMAQPGVLGIAVECAKEWCLMDAEEHRGWIHKSLVWGVYATEEFD